MITGKLLFAQTPTRRGRRLLPTRCRCRSDLRRSVYTHWSRIRGMETNDPSLACLPPSYSVFGRQWLSCLVRPRPNIRIDALVRVRRVLLSESRRVTTVRRTHVVRAWFCPLGHGPDGCRYFGLSAGRRGSGGSAKLATLYRERGISRKRRRVVQNIWSWYVYCCSVSIHPSPSFPSMRRNPNKTAVAPGPRRLEHILQSILVESTEASATLYLAGYHRDKGEYGIVTTYVDVLVRSVQDAGGQLAAVSWKTVLAHNCIVLSLRFAQHLLDYPGPEKEHAKTMLREIQTRRGHGMLTRSKAAAGGAPFEFTGRIMTNRGSTHSSRPMHRKARNRI